MDPLSGVLSLLKPSNSMCGGFDVGGDWSLQFPRHEGIKCYAVVSGQCWLAVEGVSEAVHLKAGDCFLLPLGRPFRLASDLALPPLDFKTRYKKPLNGGIATWNGGGDVSGVGGFFGLEGKHADILLGMLPPIVHIKRESDKLALRWSMERMMQELREPQPGSFLVVQHLAHMLLVQALRAHLAGGLRGGVGWLFAPGRRADRPGHQRPARRPCPSLDLAGARGGRRDVAVGLRPEVQGDRRLDAHRLPDPLADAPGRGPAEELGRSHFGHLAIARLRIRERLQHRLQAGDGCSPRQYSRVRDLVAASD